jgi:YkoY family integral membrane protein
LVSEVILQDVAIVLTLLLLEAVLSFDNAAILAAMVRRLPRKDRRKALLYGLVGAYTLRIGAILVAAWLIRTPILKIAGGGYLVFLFLRHFTNWIRHRDAHHEVSLEGGWLRKLGVPALVAVIIQIELVDLAFAIDQVVVAVAFTNKIPLIIIASLLGILFLRLSAAALSRVMDWLPTLEHMAYVAVGYVGVKLVMLHPVFVRGATVDATGAVHGGTCVIPFIPVQHEVARGAMPGCEIPTAISLAVTLSLFLIPVFIKLVFKYPPSTPGLHEEQQNLPPIAPSLQEEEQNLPASTGRKEDPDGPPKP